MANRKTDVESILQCKWVFIDTCVILADEFPQFIQQYQGTLQKHPIYLLDTVVKEMQHLADKNPSKRAWIHQRLILLDQLLQNGRFVGVRDEAEQTRHNDQVFLRLVQKYHASGEVCVLTNDLALTEDIYNIQRQKCNARHNEIYVLRLLKAGLVLADFDITSSSKSSKQTKNNVNRPFEARASIQPEVLTKQLIQPRMQITAGSEVYLRTPEVQKVRLGEALASGGEATIYATDRPGKVCKIYHPEKLTLAYQHKIMLMTTRQIGLEKGLCWPEAVVYDRNCTIRGFIMPKVQGETLGSTFFNATWLRKHPQYTRKDLVQLALTILDVLQYAHRNNILIGDINEKNIIVHSPKKVCFVDCDSCQVEGYPCPVGFPSFTAPEMQGVDFEKKLRTLYNEQFAVAILLFMIMHPGKHPFSHQGGGDEVENIRKGHFPYPLGEKQSDGVPEGCWRYCWSHLTRGIKDEFHKTFDKSNEKRCDLDTWQRLFREYQRILNLPNSTFTGPKQNFEFDLQVFPQNRRRLKKLADQGDEFNKLRTDGKTDLQANLERLEHELEGWPGGPSNVTPMPAQTSFRPSAASQPKATSKAKPAQQFQQPQRPAQTSSYTPTYTPTYTPQRPASGQGTQKPANPPQESMLTKLKKLFGFFNS